jgi:putative addiction module component (TIGR02574 family)
MTNIEISKMSTVDRIQTMEALWDSFSVELENIKSPKWHEEILAARGEKIESGKANFISITELKAKHIKSSLLKQTYGQLM